MVDILVFSHSCLRRANRLVYNHLQDDYELNLLIIVPTEFKLGSNKSLAEDALESDAPIFEDKLIGLNPRFYFFKNSFKILRLHKPKVIYIDNDPISIQTLLIGIWAKFHLQNVICLTCENMEMSYSQLFKLRSVKKISNLFFKLLLSNITKHLVSHVFSINNSGTKIYKELGYSSVSKMPLGFDSEVFQPDLEARNTIRAELRVAEETPIIAYIGRMTYEKGIHVLLKSLSYLKDHSWILMLDEFSSTSTGYIDELKKLILDLNLANRIKYIDAKHLEIARYMNAADIVVIPSISTEFWIEQYGRVAPEAMACEKLVIASNTGALPELVGNSGILVKENDEIALKNAIYDVLTNPEKFQYMPNLALIKSSNLNIVSQAKIMSTYFKEILLK
jgi:glycosyltransferase involved in cell wall biosynthesis